MWYENTPLRTSPSLDKALGKRIYFKMDCFQPTRSFKIRGMSHAVSKRVAQGYTEFVSSSGGNAGYSLAYACNRVGAKLKVFVPASAPLHMQALMRAEGAEVVVAGQVWDDAHAAALAASKTDGAVYIAPFDDPLLWEGHATMIHECAPLMEAPDLVVLSVGGGGLLCGVMQGLEDVKWTDTQLLAMETEGAASYNAALSAGEVVDIGEINTIAGSLGARKVAETALQWSRRRPVRAGQVSDAEAFKAAVAFLNTFGAMVEPACGATLASIFQRPELLGDAQRVLVVVCGGANMDATSFKNWLERFE